jgi:hypothetical protein
MPIVDILDPLNKTLIAAANRRLSPPAQQYDEYLRNQEREKYHIDLLLGKKEDIPRTYGKDEPLELAVQKAQTRRDAEMGTDVAQANFEQNRKSKDPYYDPSLKRFKQINRRHSKHKKGLKTHKH